MCVDGEQFKTHINSVSLGVRRERFDIGKVGIARGSLDEHARQAGQVGGEGVDDGIIVRVPREVCGCAAKGAVDRNRRRRRDTAAAAVVIPMLALRTLNTEREQGESTHARTTRRFHHLP